MYTGLLALVYIIVGVITLKTLKRKKMKIANCVYGVAFFVLAFYIPIYSGFNLMTLIASTQLPDFYAASFARRMQAPLTLATPFVAYSYIFLIIISVFLLLSAAFIAVEIIHRIRQNKKQEYTLLPRSDYRKFLFIKDNDGVDRSGVRYIFCRYNC